ncbi:hypothetical protein IF597_001810 [Salmonella enterica]|nr:hypothetical protein [Salmonella enterica]
MDNEFYTLLTDRGMAKIASALADKKQLHLQKMAVGDGGGQYYEPTASQTNLRHEVWRGGDADGRSEHCAGDARLCGCPAGRA